MKRPHIVILNPDQYRGDALGHMGNPAAVTPNMDRTVETDGVSFRNAFVQATVCTPSRCSFMSGWYPHVRGHRTMFHMMHADEPVLLKTLKDEGYWVWWGGKNDLTPGNSSPDPYCSVRHRSKGPHQHSLHGRQGWRGGEGTDGFYSFYAGLLGDDGSGNPIDNDWEVVNAAADAIRNHDKEAGDKPICLFLALGYPHPPYGVEEPYYSMIDRGRVPGRYPTPGAAAGEPWKGKPSILPGIWECQGLQEWSEERWAELRATYLGQCARIDAQYGIILDALRDAGIYDDTAVFLFSDHGDYTGDYGLVEKNQNTFEDCLTRVPFVIKPPSWVPVEPGIRDALVELIDFPATVEELTGITPGHTHFGRSLVGLMGVQGGSSADSHRDAVFTEGGRLPGETQCMETESVDNQDPKGLYYPRLRLQRAEGPYHGKAVMCRNDRYKYVRRMLETDELYDLVEDPGEMVNRIDDPSLEPVIAEMKERLLDFYLHTADVVPKATDPR